MVVRGFAESSFPFLCVHRYISNLGVLKGGGEARCLDQELGPADSPSPLTAVGLAGGPFWVVSCIVHTTPGRPRLLILRL